MWTDLHQKRRTEIEEMRFGAKELLEADERAIEGHLEAKQALEAQQAEAEENEQEKTKMTAKEMEAHARPAEIATRRPWDSPERLRRL